MAGLQGRFYPAGGNDSSQISGYMSDATNSKFQAIRDVDESARMDPERMRNPVRPGFDGVFNGTYTRASGPPTKFKLTITHNRDGAAGLDGLATIYLPVGSGAKAYTYDLNGIETGHDQFQLNSVDWETMPPRDFQNFRSMGFKGAVVVDLVKNTARIASVPAAGTDASDFVPKFEATWDATESADIKGVIAAQKAVDAADYAAAMKSTRPGHEDRARRNNWRPGIWSANPGLTGRATRPTCSGKSSTVVLALPSTRISSSRNCSAPTSKCTRPSTPPYCRPITKRSQSPRKPTGNLIKMAILSARTPGRSRSKWIIHAVRCRQISRVLC